MIETLLDPSRVALTWVLAPNPGPKTLSGTRTYIISADRTVWIVDPGPEDRQHAQAVVDAAVATGARRVGGILVTHHHSDHCGATSMVRRALNAATGITVPLWAADPSRVPGATLVPSELQVDGRTFAHVIHLPGHTSDSLGVLVAGGRMLTGDTLLGGSPTTINADGNLREYIQCLNILRVMCLDGRISGLYPGHGEIVEGPTQSLAEIEAQLAHRNERIEEIRRARARGALTVRRLIDDIYAPAFERRREAGASDAEIQALREAAELNVRAVLQYLTEPPL